MATHTLENFIVEIPPHPEDGRKWQFRLILDNGRTIYADEIVELARILVGPTYPDAGEPLTQLTIERQFSARRRFAIGFAIRSQAVVLASLEREGIFDIKRVSDDSRVQPDNDLIILRSPAFTMERPIRARDAALCRWMRCSESVGSGAPSSSRSHTATAVSAKALGIRTSTSGSFLAAKGRSQRGQHARVTAILRLCLRIDHADRSLVDCSLLTDDHSRVTHSELFVAMAAFAREPHLSTSRGD